jgi:hypothetical protein
MRRATFLVLIAACLAALAGCAGRDVVGDARPAGGMGMGGSGSAMVSGVVAASGSATLAPGAVADASGALTIPRVVSPGSAWIVVRSASAPGGVLGAALVPAGESRDVKVRLATLDGARVRIALHADRGTPGVFEFDPASPERSLDKPVYVDNLPIEREAAIGGYAVEAVPNSVLLMVEDQRSPVGALRVRYLLLPGPAWISVNLVEKGLPGRRVGLLARPAGESQEIDVPLDAPAGPGGLAVTVFADRGRIGTFEYDAADPLGSTDRPYSSAGVVATQRIRIR